MKTIFCLRFLFIFAVLFFPNLSDAQNIQVAQTPQGIIRDEIIFLEGTTLPANAQTASQTNIIVNAPPPFSVFKSSLNGLISRINNANPNQKETKMLSNSLSWFRLPHYLDDTQEGYTIRIVERNSGNMVCQFALGKANNRAKIYRNSETVVDFDEKYKIATLKLSGKPFCQIKLEKEQFFIQILQLSSSNLDVFVKKADKL